MSNLPKGWKQENLSELVDKIIDYRGKTPKKLGLDWSEKGKYRALSAKSVKTGGLVNKDQINLGDEKLYKAWMKDEIEYDDILLTSEAPMGEVIIWKSEEKIILSQRLFAIRIKKNISSDYIYYYFISKVFQSELLARASGTTVIGIKQTELLKTNVILPESLDEQKAIANILSSFDKKIELLKEQNQTLETMAGAIFKEWFVDFNYPNATGEMIDSEMGEIPKGWRYGILNDEFKITMGQSPKGTSYNEIGNGEVFYQGRAEFTNRFPKNRLFTTEPKRFANKFDVLISVRAPVGDINVANEKCCIGRGLASINCEYKSYALYKMKYLKKQFDVFESEGTVFGSINKSSLENLKVIIPLENIIKDYELIAKSIDLKIYNNSKQIQILTNTRDSLLPKLMSGEVRVEI